MSVYYCVCHYAYGSDAQYRTEQQIPVNLSSYPQAFVNF